MIVYKSGSKLIGEIHETSLQNTQVAIWSLGNTGLVIKTGSSSEWFCVDPYLSSRIEERDPTTEFVRAFPAPLEPTQLAGASAVLVTHHHDDHMDFLTLGPLQGVSPATRFYLPQAHLDLCLQNGMARNGLYGLREGQQFQVGTTSITPIAAAHTAYEQDQDGNDLYLGYLIDADGVKIYVSGDTLVTPRMVEQVAGFQPDVVVLPINGGDYARTSRGIVGNLNYREAVDFALEVGADMIIPVHYDLFPNNRENPAYFVDYLFSKQVPLKFHMLLPGERFIYEPVHR